MRHWETTEASVLALHTQTPNITQFVETREVVWCPVTEHIFHTFVLIHLNLIPYDSIKWKYSYALKK